MDFPVMVDYSAATMTQSSVSIAAEPVELRATGFARPDSPERLLAHALFDLFRGRT
jgi:hypothetical protein